MTETEIRAAVVSGLAQASAFMFRESGIQAAFLTGEADMAIEDIEMDSLSIMELCIAIELDTGVSILPDEMQQIATLGKLVTVIQQKLS